MIIKVIGVCDGLYRERTWEDVEDYIFTNEGLDLEDLVFEGDKKVPYSHLKLIFPNRDPICLSFNTRAFVMEGSTGKTIDVLQHKDRV